MAITGTTVRLLDRLQTGTDPFNRPVYATLPVDVENVLVGQPNSPEVTDTLNLTGKKAVYALGIPKGDGHEWTDRLVVLPPPFEGVYRTIGFPVAGIEANIPMAWNRKVLVERYG